MLVSSAFYSITTLVHRFRLLKAYGVSDERQVCVCMTVCVYECILMACLFSRPRCQIRILYQKVLQDQFENLWRPIKSIFARKMIPQIRHTHILTYIVIIRNIQDTICKYDHCRISHMLWRSSRFFLLCCLLRFRRLYVFFNITLFNLTPHISRIHRSTYSTFYIR